MRYEKYISVPDAIWFDAVPDSWRALKMRGVFSERNTKVSDKDYPALSVGKMGVVPQLDTAVKTDNGDNRKLICKGDFAINSRSDRKGSSGISQYDGSASLIITVLKPHRSLNGRFYHYLLRSYYFAEEFYRNGHGLVSDLWTTKWDEMRNIYIPVPPREEQNQIVRYLDWQVSKINKLIHGYQRQIKLLEERRQTVIDRAVTKGVRQGRQMHSIQANWMGDIPADWKMIPSKRLFLESKERKHPDDKPATASQKYGIILQEDYMKSENKRIVIATQGLDDWKHVEPDNFVISLRSFQGGIERSEIFGCVTWHYIVLLPQKYVVPRYFKWLLKSKSYIKALQGTSEFIRDGQDLRYSNFVKVDLPLIPASEQEEIADYIEQEAAKIDRAIPVLEKEIELLKEYRTRLISDVVTGQMDVRNVEVPEYTPEEDIAEEAPEEQEVEMDAD
ncbi:restriction endonuclease subunit S [uncultured Faecalibacterium sp.]|jgi:type I restriction enzyme S subunit|uniref:restriction endonuclease subunit S n=1 Tax=uncultured Faecalibacterium sp. TaxID=259315 RepID=UPI002804F6DC|nr:restriction endonuclease subunit S [uncultured Faecalibacterium sp.]